MKKEISLAAAFIFCMPAYSATQGDLDPTSSGSFNISITIPNRVRISSLQDYSFGQYSGAGNVNIDHDICVYSNMPTGSYSVVANGDGAGSAFTITNGVETIPYNVYWNDQTGTIGAVQLTRLVSLGSQSGANAVSENCSTGGLSANLEVEMVEGNIRGNPNATYSGVLTVVVSGT